MSVGYGMPDGFVNIHGKEYETVAHRLARFRQEHPEASISTEILKDEEGVIVMRTSIYLGDVLLANGHAEEVRGSSNINKTSALENCETSSIGRALSIAKGYGAAGSIASADEVQIAVARQQYETTAKKYEPITGDQFEAVSVYLEGNEAGETLVDKILSWASVDHLKELSSQQADELLKKWSVQA